jgi:hypothetical protein
VRETSTVTATGNQHDVFSLSPALVFLKGIARCKVFGLELSPTSSTPQEGGISIISTTFLKLIHTYLSFAKRLVFFERELSMCMPGHKAHEDQHKTDYNAM